MRSSWQWIVAGLVLAGWTSGCGLVLDVDPLDPVPGVDAGHMDAGRIDAGARDAGRPGCRTDVECDDGIACTTDLCGEGGCAHVPDDTACTAMPGGECVAGEGCEYPVCVLGVTCVAENPCQQVVCDGDACVREPVVCADGQMCCGGACVAEGCNDRNPCTTDRCEPSMGCTNTPTSGSSCEDGSPCTVGDRCQSGTCVAGGPRCTTSDMCRRATCDPSSGACATAPVMDGTACSDLDACTIGDQCMGGSCRSGTGRPTCDDSEPCTDDVCDGNTGCENRPRPDGTDCALAGALGMCTSGRCVAVAACVVGTVDCDGDGDCECTGRCGMLGDCIASSSVCVMACPVGSTCCGVTSSPQYGRCISPSDVCLGGTCCADLSGSAG